MISNNAIDHYSNWLSESYDADINGWYIEDNFLTFELTRMNDKWWINVPFTELESWWEQYPESLND